MASNAKTSNLLVSHSGFLTAHARQAYWRLYQDWLVGASLEEMEQLQAVLDEFNTIQLQSMMSLIQELLTDQIRRKKVPPSLVEQVREANWLDAATGG